jgi:phosphatidylglycerol lysyltransferase
MPMSPLYDLPTQELDFPRPLDMSDLRTEAPVATLSDPDLDPVPVVPETLSLRRVGSLTPAEFEAFERLAYEHGEYAESYLAVEPERYCFLSADREAAVSVIPAGRFLHIAGGILASLERRPRMIADLAAHAQRTGKTVACFAVGEVDRPLFEAAGWEVSKFGEDTDIDLETLRWSGKPYEWVRRQFNFCKRAGLVCREIVPQDLSDDAWKKTKDVLFEILHEDLKDRIYSREMGLLVGKLQPDNLGRRRLFVAENTKTNQIEGFLIANPMRGGRGWAIESYRKRHSATRGAIPFLMKAAIDQFQADGAQTVSLCMLLWKDTQTFENNKSGGFLAWWLATGQRIADKVYSTNGMIHFKTRFRPTLTNIYLCVTPRTTLFMSLSFLNAVGAFSFSWSNIAKSALHSLRGRLSLLFRRGGKPESMGDSQPDKPAETPEPELTAK